MIKIDDLIKSISDLSVNLIGAFCKPLDHESQCQMVDVDTNSNSLVNNREGTNKMNSRRRIFVLSGMLAGAMVGHPILSGMVWRGERKQTVDEVSNWIAKKILAFTIALLVLSGATSANAFECSNATLDGEYAFSDTNYTTSSVVNGIKYFDGDGSLTQRDYQGDSLRTMNLADFSTGEYGEYSVNSDCTGSMTINIPVPGTSTGVLKVLFVISGRGQHIHEVVAEFTPPGAANPVPTQSSADDWKVDR